MKKLVLLIIVLAVCGAAGGEQTSPPIVELQVVIDAPADLERLAEIVTIDAFDGRTARVVAVPEHVERLRLAGFAFAPVPGKIKIAATMCPEGWELDEPPAWTCYPTYPQYTALLERLALLNPATCSLVDFGPTTNEERPHRLFALKITTEPDIEQARPEVLLTSTMHGDEVVGYVLLLRLAYELLDGFFVDPDIRDLLESTEIWINPLANPDGTYYGGDDTVDSAIRFFTTNSGGYTGVDPNRNFPDPRRGLNPDGQQWWRETRAVMDFVSSRSFVLSANLHGGAEVINYPWDTWCERHPDDEWWYDLSLQWATTAQHDGPTGYMDDCFYPLCSGGACTPGVSNGADWYSVAGSRQDYMTYFRRGRELTAEISISKMPPATQLESFWQANRNVFLEYLISALKGVHGIVRDPLGRPLSASISIPGLDTSEAQSAVMTDPDIGDFHRLLLPGTYDLVVSASGFKNQTLTGIVVPDSPPYPQLEIMLEPSPGPVSPPLDISDD